MGRMLEITKRTGANLALLSTLTCALSGNLFAWSVSGTVKSSTGTALAGVAVTVQDSSKYSTTTDATGNFAFQTAGVVPQGKTIKACFAQLVGRELIVQSPIDGAMQLSFVDASGRSIWEANTIAAQGIASVLLPTSLRSGAIFLRIRHAGGVEYQAVGMGSKGLQVDPTRAAAREMAANPILVFKLTGYDSATYAMTSSTATGITVTMKPSTICDLPTTFKWKDNGAPIASPKNGWAAIKDFSMVHYNGQYYVYMTYSPAAGGFQSAAMAPFTDFTKAKDAAQTATNTGVAPELIYFTPKNTWIMSKQWCGGASFCYMTSSTPTPASSFTQKGNLLTETITDGGKAPIDQVVICDDKNCYIFYADDNGRIYRGSMPIGSFPGVFTGTKKILEESTPARLFEAVEVYKLKGQKKYLMIVECGYPRYFRAFTATDLGGTWTPLANATTQAVPFAGKNNVSNGWSDDISHGDIVREGYDETRTIDPCNLQMIYQGQMRNNGVTDYSKLPYQMGLITLQK